MVTGVTAAVLGVAGLSGCSGGASSAAPAASGASAPAVSSASSSAAQMVVAATRKGQQKSTAKFTTVTTTSTAGQQATIHANGEVDNAAKATSITMTVGAPGSGTKLNLQERLVDGSVYLKGAPATGTKWVKVKTEQVSQFTQAGDPADQLAMLQQLGGDVHEAGSATVHGVSTTRYTGSLDLSKGSAGAGARFSAQAKQLGLKEIPFALYVDRDGLPARMTMTMKGSGVSAGAGGISVSMVLDWTDWGTPVHITAPAGAVSQT